MRTGVDLGGDLSRRPHWLFRIGLDERMPLLVVIKKSFAVADPVLLNIMFLSSDRSKAGAAIDGGFVSLQEAKAKKLKKRSFIFSFGDDQVIAAVGRSAPA